MALDFLQMGMQALHDEEVRRQQLKLEGENFLSDPMNTNRLISHVARSIVPQSKLDKIGANAPMEKVINAIPEDDPRGAILAQTMGQAGDYVKMNPHLHPKEAILNLYNQNLDENKDLVYQTMQKGYSTIGNTLRKAVGLMPKDNYAPIEGYDEWKKQDDLKHPDVNEYTNPLLSAAMVGIPKLLGYGAEKAVEKGATGLTVRMAAKYLGRGISAVPHPAAKIAGMALMAIPEFLAFDVASNAVKNSEWARNRSALLTVPAELAAGGLGIAGFAKGTKLFNKARTLLGATKEATEKVMTSPTAENIMNMAGAESASNKAESFVDKWRKMSIGEQDFNEMTGMSGMPGMNGMSGAVKPSPFEEYAGAINKIQEMTGKSTEEALGMAQAQELLGNATLFKKALQVHETIINPEKQKLFAKIISGSEDTSGWLKSGRVLKNNVKPEEVLMSGLKNTEIDSILNKFEPGFKDVHESSNILKSPELLEQAKNDPIVASRLVDDAFAEVRINKMSTRLTEMQKNQLEDIASGFDFFFPESLKIKQTPSKFSILEKEIADSVKGITFPKAKVPVGKSVKHTPMSAGTPKSETDLAWKKANQFIFDTYGERGGQDAVKVAQDAFNAIERGELEHVSISQAQQMKIPIPLPKEAESVGKHILSSTNVTEDVSTILKGGSTLSEVEEGLLSSAKYQDVIDEHIKRWTEKVTSGKVNGSGRNGTVLGLAIATAGSISLSSLLAPDNAEAGVVDKITETIGKRLVSKYTVDMAKTTAEGTGRSMQDVVKEMVENNLVTLPPKPGQKSLNPLQRQIIVTPDITNLSLGQAKSPLGWKRYLTKGVQADLLYGTFDQTGRMKMTSPMIQLSHAIQSAEINTKYNMDVVNNILKDIPSNAKEVETSLKPLYDKYYSVSPQLGFYKTQIDTLQANIDRGVKRLLNPRIKGEARETLSATLENMKSSLDDYKGKFDMLKPEFDNIQKEYDPIIKELAQKYPSVRIKLAARGYGMEEGNAWLTPLLNDNEKVAAGHIRKFLDDLVPYIEEVGEKTIQREPFVPFSAPSSIDFGKINGELEKLAPFGYKSFPLAHLNSRMIAGLDMMPDIHYSMNQYIPDVMKRMQLAEFWKEGKKGGWAEHALIAEKNGLRGASEFWQGVKDGLKPQLNTPTNKILRQLYSFEAAIRLAVSPAVALKHAVKMESTWSTAGFGHAMQVMPRTIKTYYNNVAADITKSITGTRPETSLVESAADALSNQNRIAAVISDMNLYEPPASWFEKVMDKMNEKGSVLVANTERFDRFHATIAALDMAAKQGMTAEQATYGVMDMIMKNNFLSGNFNPSWLQNPKTRLMMMFQGTPFKILEQRMLLASRAGKSFSDAAGLTWKTLQQLRGDVKEGEAIVKAGLIKDALSNQKDIFGNAYSHQLMRKAMILGTMVLGGRELFDSDLSGHALHIPGVKIEGGAKLSLNPFVNAALQAKPQEDEFWLSAFFKKWLPAGPIPMMLNKTVRLNDDDIPKIYKDNKIAYLFSIPQISDK